MGLPAEPGLWNFYRFGIAREKSLLKRWRDAYSGVVIPAHIASYYSASCAEFVGTLRKPYFIDPITYIFARNPSLIRRFVKDKEGRTLKDRFGRKKKGTIKRSYSKLVENAYQGVVQKAVEAERPLSTRDLREKGVLRKLTKAVLEFQTETLSSIPSKYRKYLPEDELSAINPPAFVVPPYFFIPSGDPENWTDINYRAAEEALRLTELPVFAVLFVEPSELPGLVATLAERYAGLELGGYLLWVNGFDGKTADEATIVNVGNSITALAAHGRPVVMMYSDAVALVLRQFGLRGYCSGICYGEAKEVDKDVDIAGAIPRRYYLPFLKRKVQVETTLMRADFTEHPRLRCGCAVCAEQSDVRRLDEDGTREHFLLARAEEIASARETTAAELREQLSEAYEAYRNDPIFGAVPHLRRWAEALSTPAPISQSDRAPVPPTGAEGA